MKAERSSPVEQGKESEVRAIGARIVSLQAEALVSPGIEVAMDSGLIAKWRKLSKIIITTLGSRFFLTKAVESQVLGGRLLAGIEAQWLCRARQSRTEKA